MRDPNSTNARVIVLAFLVGCLVGASWLSSPGAVNAQAGSKYNHFHFGEGICIVGNVRGKAVIDLRNGNAWCVPIGNAAPAFQGTLNLAAIPERAPAVP